MSCPTKEGLYLCNAASHTWGSIVVMLSIETTLSNLHRLDRKSRPLIFLLSVVIATSSISSSYPVDSRIYIRPISTDYLQRLRGVRNNASFRVTIINHDVQWR